VRRTLLVLSGLLAAGVLLVGCAGPLGLTQGYVSEDLARNSMSLPLGASDRSMTLTLCAGKALDVGTVTVRPDGANLCVEYATANGWALFESHLAVACSVDEIPQTKKGNPKLGQFSYKVTHTPGTTSHVYVVPLEPFVSAGLDLVVLAAHAEVHLADRDGVLIQEEGAWAEGTSFPGANWAMFFEFSLPSCSDLEWALHTTTNEGKRLHEISMVSATDGWASGDRGHIYHYDGGRWVLHSQMPQKSTLQTIEMVTATDGWAGGDERRFYHYDGTSWTLHTEIGGSAVRGIDMLSESSGWAVCYGGHIYYYDGVSWTLHTSTSEGTQLYAVDMVAADDGWAVGYGGRIYHYDGSTWTLHTDTPCDWFLALEMVSATEGWTVGQSGKIFHYDGTSWTLHTTTVERENLYKISMVSESDGWIVGEGGVIYRYDGANWSLHTQTPEGSRLAGIEMLSGCEGWIVGSAGRIYHGSP